MKKDPRIEAHIRELPVLLNSEKQELLGFSPEVDGFGMKIGYSSYGSLVERLPMTPEELIRFLHTRHFQGAESTANEASTFGRIKNKLSGATPYYAELPGQILVAAYEFLEQDAPEGVAHGKAYYLRIDHAKAVSDAVKAKYKGESVDIAEVKLEVGSPVAAPKPSSPTVRR